MRNTIKSVVDLVAQILFQVVHFAINKPNLLDSDPNAPQIDDKEKTKLFECNEKDFYRKTTLFLFKHHWMVLRLFYFTIYISLCLNSFFR